MMEVNVKEAREKISALLDRTQKGEEISILRRGKKVARLLPAADAEKRLPDLDSFRASITSKGGSLSRAVIDGRNEERY
ncbi:type II toxin-antitoxin system Phd/YefM family antitoxin [Desulfosudis oleivorans]|uniref:Antitoxin n=1 Tax=Desulfosudis oleivorans (strain DSM 6200 / JCM 39069 / Hxd3) TaxID=96561 RepID=A9A0W1_DESOH|nr:type II toxin-antitoxin system prevent-host-death family antitoxin [Desulfosudis oleivorans]ABW67586.1 prevent-host-death family protein [Desulfosudis oleivorans Hxd3]